MYKKEVYGKGCIVARIVADSVADNSGTRITTFELEYPRFIHSELMTHRMFSRNAMSSRAVPIAKMIEQVRENPAMPIHWGINHPGMQSKTVHNNPEGCELAWCDAANSAAEWAEAVSEISNLHKQIVNRILEPFQVMKTVVTATEWNNWWYLREHEDAQPEIAELACVMREAYNESKPELLRNGSWHTPYVKHLYRSVAAGCGYYIEDDSGFVELTLEEALKVSSSCCAQVSFRLNDNSIDKALRIYDRLVESKPTHASPFEHQATPMEVPQIKCSGGVIFPEEHVTHFDTRDNYWSGNFKHWIQHRQLIEDHVKRG